MELTLNEALSKIGTEGYTGVEGLQRLVSETSAVARNATANAQTLLYSGSMGDIQAWQAANEISDHSFDANGKKQVVTIADTDVYDLLNDPLFERTLFDAVGKNPEEYARILEGKDLADNRISNTSFWDTASKMLARSAPGDFLALTPNALENSVFSQSEFTEILNNPDLTNRHVNGTSVEDLRRLQSDLITKGLAGNDVEANRMTLDYVNRQSALQTENLKLQLDPETKQLTGIGSKDYFEKLGLDSLSVERSADLLGRNAEFLKVSGTIIEPESLKSFIQTNELIKGYQQERVSTFEAAGDLGGAAEAGRALNRLNAVGLVLGLTLIASEAMAASLAGDSERAHDIVSEGLTEFAKGAAFFGGIELAAVAIGAIVGLPIGALVGSLLLAYGAFGALTLVPTLLQSLNDLFNSAAKYVQPVRRDPLTLDLDGDGLETVGTAAGILFDQTGNGVKTGTGWVNSDDGLLVLDRNGNGTIDNGRELFGDAMIKSNGQLATDGFDALRDLDSNADGKINSSDTQFANLRLWRDLNQDGISQSNELFTLGSQNIAAINAGSTANSQILSNGNQLADLGSFIKTDGSSGTLGEVTGNLGDINLAQNTFLSQFVDHLDTSAVTSLPDMQACPERSRRDAGQIRNLRETANHYLWRMAA